MNRLLTYIFVSLNILISQSPDIIKLGNDWYQVISFVTISNITPEEAKRRAIEDALRKAVEYHSGIEINSRSTSFQSETNKNIGLDWFSQMTNALSEGVVLEKEVVSSSHKTLLGKLIYEVVVKVKVGQQKGERDPLFKLKANLDRVVYKDGDEVSITVSSTMDCYLYLFNLSSNDSVYVFLPNEHIEDNYLESGGTLTVPDAIARGKGIKYKVRLLPGKTEDTEMIKVLAVKSKKGTDRRDFDLILGDYKMALKELQYFLVDLPLDQVAEVDLIYKVLK